MEHKFISINQLLSELEKDFINLLYDHNLLNKLDKNAKKLFIYFFIHKINEVLHDKHLLIYHNKRLSSNSNLLTCFNDSSNIEDKWNDLINKLCNKIKQITNRLFFISNKIDIPRIGKINELDGEIVDEIILMKNETPDLKRLNDFLKKNNLKNIFASITKNV